MAMKFMGAAIMVADVARSRQFYEGLLGQAVEMDNGPTWPLPAVFPSGKRTTPTR